MATSNSAVGMGIPPNAVAISITHMQTPSCFWAHELKRKELDLLEKEITKLNENKWAEGVQYQPSNGEIVAVLEPKTNTWVRGIAVNWQPKKRGEVFLMDYGYTLDHASNLQRLPSSAKALKPQCFQIFLDGVLPLANCYDYSAAKFTLILGESWMPAATVKVRKLLDRSSHFYFKCVNKWGDAMIGNLYIMLPNQPKATSLAAALCDNELAVVDLDRFAAEINIKVKPLVISWNQLLKPTFKTCTAENFASAKLLPNSDRSEPVKMHQDVRVAEGSRHYVPTKNYEETAQNNTRYKNEGFQTSAMSGQASQDHHRYAGRNVYSKMSIHSDITPLKLPSNPPYNRREQVSQTQVPKANGTQSRDKRYHEDFDADVKISSRNPSTLNDSAVLSELTGNLVSRHHGKQQFERDAQFRHGAKYSKEEVAKNDVVPKPNFNYLKPLTSKGSFYDNRPPYYKFPVRKLDSQTASSTYSGDCPEVWTPQLMDRLTQTPVLVHSKKPLKAISSIAAAPLHCDVHKAMQALNCNAITNQQKYMWPAVLRNQNVISVGGQETGKTLGFLAPMASNLLDTGLYKELNRSVGPLVLILCANAEKVVKAEKWLKHLTKNEFTDYPTSNHQEPTLRVKIFVTYGGCVEKQKAEELLNGCQVLITTPPCLVRIMDYFEHAVDLNRLCHLVFDDADVLFEQFKGCVDRILAECKKSLGLEWRKDRALQVVATCRKWSPQIDAFARHVAVEPTVVVSSGFEVLAYCKIPPMVHLLHSPNTRPQQVSEIARKHCGTSKTVVICNTKEEAVNMFHLMKNYCRSLLIAHDSMDQFEITKVCERWFSFHQPGMLPMLIVTDSVFTELGISDVSVLIHHSLPFMKDVFNARIACILDKCPENWNNNKATCPEVHIFLDENDGKQTPAIVELLTRLKVKVPESLEERVKETLRIREEMKVDATLCANLRNFGYCNSQRSCPFRHAVVADLDKNPPEIPQIGEVQLKVMHIHSATHYSARLVKHTNPDGLSTDRVTKEHVFLPIEMSEHFGKQANSNECEQLTDKNLNLDFKEKFKPWSCVGVEEENADVLSKRMKVYESITSNPQDFHRQLVCDPAAKSAMQGVQDKQRNLTLYEISDDVFNAKEDVSLVHCVAEDFIMTKGIARQFNEKFGGVKILLRQNKKTGEVACLQHGNKFIFYLVIKKRTSLHCIPTMASVKQSLQDLRKYCVNLKVEHLAMPRICTGNNLLPWKAVKDCIEKIFCDVNIIISVYHCIVVEVKGDIRKVPLSVSLAHCVAQDFKMTRGVACAFRYNFGNLDFLRSQEKKVGEIAVLKSHSRYVFYLVTKKQSTFDCKPTLESMAACLAELRESCVYYKVRRLAIPKIGTGIDKLLWRDVKQLIENIFSNTEVSITVYKLPEKESWDDTKDQKEMHHEYATGSGEEA